MFLKYAENSTGDLLVEFPASENSNDEFSFEFSAAENSKSCGKLDAGNSRFTCLNPYRLIVAILTSGGSFVHDLLTMP